MSEISLELFFLVLYFLKFLIESKIFGNLKVAEISAAVSFTNQASNQT